MTPRQQQLVDFVITYRHTHGISPTIQEIADALHVSKVTIFDHTQKLRKARVIRTEKNMARSISIVGDELAAKWPKFPVLGEVSDDGIIGAHLMSRHHGDK